MSEKNEGKDNKRKKDIVSNAMEFLQEIQMSEEQKELMVFARKNKDLYDAHIKAGFTQRQSLEIVLKVIEVSSN